jgi:hypothetical protein
MLNRLNTLGAALVVVFAVGCESESTKPAAGDDTTKTAAGDDKAAGDTPEAADGEFDAKALAERIGVAVGSWEPDESVGAPAVIAAHDGTVEVRRVGAEAFEKVRRERV